MSAAQTAGDLDLLTVPEVAAMLRKPEGTLRYWRSIDAGPRSFMRGVTVVYRPSEVVAWVRAKEEATGHGERLTSADADIFPLLTMPEVAALTRVSEQRLRYKRSTNTGPWSFRIGSTVVYRRADVEAWLDAEEHATERGGAA